MKEQLTLLMHDWDSAESVQLGNIICLESLLVFFKSKRGRRELIENDNVIKAFISRRPFKVGVEARSSVSVLPKSLPRDEEPLKSAR